MQLGGKQPLCPRYPGVGQGQPAALHLQLSRNHPFEGHFVWEAANIRRRGLAGVLGWVSGSRARCLEQQRVAQEHCAPPWTQSALGEKHWWCLHLQQSYKSPVKSKTASCLRGRASSCGGTAGRVSFGEGERDRRVSACSCFIWIHLAPLWEVL